MGNNTDSAKVIISVSVLLFSLLSNPAAGFDRTVTSDDESNSDISAGQLFGAQVSPTLQRSEAIGFYTKGCLAGAERIAEYGENWQVMRLSRNRNWGHPRLIAYIQRLAQDAKQWDGWRGLLIGDMSQPRGGPMSSAHKSHQSGLDADIWLQPAPQRRLTFEERESLNAIALNLDHFHIDTEKWSEQHARLLRRAASYPEVARIFVHPTIKKSLCDWAGTKRAWLRKIRAWYGHQDHFHVRLACPETSTRCVDQIEPPADDGCGKELDWWFSENAYQPRPEETPSPPLTLDQLPPACRTLINIE